MTATSYRDYAEAWNRLQSEVDLLIQDGNGRLHQMRVTRERSRKISNQEGYVAGLKHIANKMKKAIEVRTKEAEQVEVDI